jgi:hypothetical protein
MTHDLTHDFTHDTRLLTHDTQGHSYRYGMAASLHCSSMAIVYILWLFYIVRVYSVFQAEFVGDIFVFLLQILAEFFTITSEISRPDGIDKTIYRKQFGNFRRCAGFNLTKEPVRRKSEYN